MKGGSQRVSAQGLDIGFLKKGSLKGAISGVDMSSYYRVPLKGFLKGFYQGYYKGLGF